MIKNGQIVKKHLKTTIWKHGPQKDAETTSNVPVCMVSGQCERKRFYRSGGKRSRSIVNLSISNSHKSKLPVCMVNSQLWIKDPSHNKTSYRFGGVSSQLWIKSLSAKQVTGLVNKRSIVNKGPLSQQNKLPVWCGKRSIMNKGPLSQQNKLPVWWVSVNNQQRSQHFSPFNRFCSDIRSFRKERRSFFRG
jgi:hypothetical protein